MRSGITIGAASLHWPSLGGNDGLFLRKWFLQAVGDWEKLLCADLKAVHAHARQEAHAIFQKNADVDFRTLNSEYKMKLEEKINVSDVKEGIVPSVFIVQGYIKFLVEIVNIFI